MVWNGLWVLCLLFSLISNNLAMAKIAENKTNLNLAFKLFSVSLCHILHDYDCEMNGYKALR